MRHSFRWMVVAVGLHLAWLLSKTTLPVFDGRNISADMLYSATTALTNSDSGSGDNTSSKTRESVVVLQNYPELPLENINYEPSLKQSRFGTHTQTTTTNYYWSLLSKFRMTRIKDPKPQLGQVRVKESSTDATLPESAFYPRYQCAGKSYDNYMEQVAQMVARKLQLSAAAAAAVVSDALADYNAWGRRRTMVPPSTSTSANRNILMIGNSHTRQVAVALEWQYKKQVTHFEYKDGYAIVETFTRRTTKQETTTTLSIIYNHPSVYSPRWKENLEEYVLGHSLSEFDAIVLGSFNVYDPAFKDATLWQHASNYSRAFPQQQIPEFGGEVGLSLPKLIEAYDGPIVALSGFLYDHHVEHDQNVQTIQSVAAQTGRTNLRAINSRAPLEAVAKKGCTNNAGIVMECQDFGSHQCVGDKGGIPDLVAWDVVEAFYDLLP